MKNLWISLPLSLICLFAQANTTTVASTVPVSVAPTAAKAPAKAAAPGASTTSAVNTSVAAAPAAAAPATTSFMLTLGGEYGWQSEQQPDGKREQTMTYHINPGMARGDYKFFIDEYFEQNLVEPSADHVDQWTDPVFIATKKAWEPSSYFKLTPTVTMTMPVTNESRNNVGMLYAATAAIGVGLNTKTLGMDAWSFGYQLRFGKTFTQYDTNAGTGKPNPSSSIRNRFTMGYQITDALGFSQLFDFRSSFNVAGTVTNSFLTSTSLSYDVAEGVSVSVGHSNDSPYLKGENYDNNLKFYDNEKSHYSLGVEVSI